MPSARKTPTRAGIGVSQNSTLPEPRQHSLTIRELQARILSRRHLLPPDVARLVAELHFAEAGQ